MRTGSSCRVHQKALKKSTSTHFDGIKVNWCAVHTLQITKFQAFLALKSKLSTHLDRTATEAYAHGGLCPMPDSTSYESSKGYIAS